MDYKGHQLSENIYYFLTIICGLIAWIVGYVKEDFQLTVYGWAVGLGLSLILCIPDWPMFNRHPVQWLDEVGSRSSKAIKGSKDDKKDKKKKDKDDKKSSKTSTKKDKDESKDKDASKVKDATKDKDATKVKDASKDKDSKETTESKDSKETDEAINTLIAESDIEPPISRQIS